jgi:hypothetical protein
MTKPPHFPQIALVQFGLLWLARGYLLLTSQRPLHQLCQGRNEWRDDAHVVRGYSNKVRVLFSERPRPLRLLQNLESMKNFRPLLAIGNFVPDFLLEIREDFLLRNVTMFTGCRYFAY